MRYRSFYTVFFPVILGSLVSCQEPGNNPKIDFVNREADKKVDVMIGGKLFTSYCWPENVYKPILYPVYTSTGTEITRGFPLKPRKGERNDHIHQVGIWLNYGKVNGFDFWGNGHRGIKEPDGGVIRHLKFEKLSPGKREGMILASSGWISPDGYELLGEKTEYHFIAKGQIRIIDRIMTLTANDSTVKFDDTKEGMLGIRIARQLELPVNENVALLDAAGNPSAEKVNAAIGATGNYRSSEGITGNAVWGTRARWMDLYGAIGDEKISVVICDHPENPAYPTYWHARGYGLFAANPLGWNDFTRGEEQLNYSIEPGKSVTFRYRIIISSGSHLSDSEINNLADEFSKKY